MADNKKDPKKVFSFRFNLSWLYFLLLIGVGYLLFSNQRSAAPEKYVERFAKAGASMISFHYEAAREGSAALIEKIQDLGVKAGIVINPDCPVQDIFPYLHQVDFVLLMSVFAGFGGQKFIPATLERVRTVRAELDRMGRLGVPIEVDGGIGPENAGVVVAAGAEILVAGSAVFKAEDPEAAIAKMRI